MLAERGILRLTGLSVKVFRRSWRRASMTENGHVGICTLPNRLPDSAMAQEGKTPAQIGDLLGYSPATFSEC
ncbi:ydeB domain protein [Escherichia coli P0299438.5]|nr:ydeB domain protein [Escherichia coli P0299438.5]